MIFYLILFLCILLVYLFSSLGRENKVPHELKEIPIQKGLPIIGIMNKVEEPLCNYLVHLSKKHGPIYRIRMGMRDIVVLNTFEYIKAAMVDNGQALSGRWKSFKYLFVTNDSGISFIDGNVWYQQRSFVLKTLKDFGIGSSRSNDMVQEECTRMLEELDNLEGQKINFANFVSIYIANVIVKFVMNKRFTHGDPEYDVIDKFLVTAVTQKDPLSNILLMFPFIENNDWLIRFIMWITSRKLIVDDCHDWLKREIKEHKDNIDFNSEGDDLIDRFLIKQHKMKEKSGNVEYFTDWDLVTTGLDLIIAGYDTTTFLLVWTFMFMGRYPEVQNKVHEEIIDKIGNERLPKMSDKTALCYTQAVMDEVLRLSSVGPLGVFHRTLNDVSVKGYFIPSNTVVITNLFACHLDPNVWEKPLEFYPEHFLSTDGNGVMKYKPREELIPFGMGKRQCIAESLARMEYFIFYTSVLQRFQIAVIDKGVHFDVFNSKGGIIRAPDLRDFIFTKREDLREK